MNRMTACLFALLRAALQGRMEDTAPFVSCDEALWQAVYDVSSRQGVLALAWDGLQLLPEGLRPPQALCRQWAFNVERTERRYRRQAGLIARLASFYRRHGMPMMLLKGYGLSLLYPVPEHRPCGDIDIWLFGRQPEADRLIAREWGIAVDMQREHHTIFRVDGIMVENHFDFVNTQSHTSNRRIERALKRYAAQPGLEIGVSGSRVLLPSVQFNALFLLRHAAVHFAANNVALRHLVDWSLFVGKCGERIDWTALHAVARAGRMGRFLNCLNGLCVDCLGLDASSIPPFGRDAALERRVLAEMLSPAFSRTKPSGGFRIVSFKVRRWLSNVWKHRLVYDEWLSTAFLQSLWTHLKRPRSIVE